MKKSVLLVLVFLIFACDEQAIKITLDNGYDFYPLETGNYWVYEVEQVDIIGFARDTTRFFLREVLTDSLISENGTIKYLIERQVSYDSLSWEVDSIWSVYRLDHSLVVIENNQAKVKLTFPVKSGIIWDGNAYNNLSESQFYYKSLDSELEISSIPDSTQTIQVVLSDIEKNIVNQDERYEVYGRGIGLVTKDYTELNFCSVNCELPGEIESGRVLKQRLIAYGQN